MNPPRISLAGRVTNSESHSDRFALSRRGLFRVLIAGPIIAKSLEPSAARARTETGDVARCTVPQVQTEYGSFVVENLALSLRDFSITGNIRNDTDRKWRWASFLLSMRDEKGHVIQHDDRFDGYFYLKDIGKKETRSIVSIDGKLPKLLLKPLRRPVSVEIKYLPERSYFDSSYAFALTHPTFNKDLTYHDDVLEIRFNVTQKELRFTLVNRQPEPITIDWEKATYIDLSGNKHRVIHNGVRLTDKDRKQAPTRLDGGASLDDMVYPADLVAGSRVFEDWRLNPILPLSQYAQDYKWRTFGLLLPLEAAGKARQYLFTIRIENVTVL